MISVTHTLDKPVNPDRVIHYEHPRKPGEAWCGAPVQGVYKNAPIGCEDCAALFTCGPKLPLPEEGDHADR